MTSLRNRFFIDVADWTGGFTWLFLLLVFLISVNFGAFGVDSIILNRAVAMLFISPCVILDRRIVSLGLSSGAKIVRFFTCSGRGRSAKRRREGASGRERGRGFGRETGYAWRGRRAYASLNREGFSAPHMNGMVGECTYIPGGWQGHRRRCGSKDTECQEGKVTRMKGNHSCWVDRNEGC